MQLKKKMRVIVDSNEGIGYLQRDSLVTIIFNEFTIKAGIIAEKLQRLSQLESNFPQMVEQQLKQKLTPLVEENRILKAQLEEKIQPVQQYESEINTLNKEKETLIKSNADLTSKVETHEENIQSLKDKNQDLKDSITNKDKSTQNDLNLRFIADKYGKYLSLRNLARVVNIFIEDPSREWRQTQIAHHEGLLKMMAGPTILNHLYDAKEKGIVHCPVFPGTYKLSLSEYGGMGPDMEALIRFIMGDAIVDIALEQFLKKESYKHH